MVMVADFVPGLKRYVRSAGLKPAAQSMVLRVVIAFLLHSGKMSCLQAAGSVRSEARHRAQVGRCLRRPSFRRRDINRVLRQQLLERESGRGRFIFLIDATLCSQSGKKGSGMPIPEKKKTRIAANREIPSPSIVHSREIVSRVTIAADSARAASEDNAKSAAAAAEAGG